MTNPYLCISNLSLILATNCFVLAPVSVLTILEATNAISNADFKSKSFVALKEARESLYWINLLYRNGYLDDKQYNSIYATCEELVKVLTFRCKKLNESNDDEK